LIFSFREYIKVAREKYKMGGTVQHGASTLPDEMFHKFKEHGAVEVHLATGFQNLIFDHPYFPTTSKLKFMTFSKAISQMR